MTTKPRLLDRAGGFARRLATARRGNVAIITAFAMIPLLFALGMGVDYTMAKRRQDQINGYADAAALAGVTPNMMAQNSTAAQTAASNMFSAQLSTIGQVTYNPNNISVTATDQASGTSLNRTVTVSYSANSTNIFSGVLGMNSIPIQGSSTATSSLSPQIDFYLLLDTSPSMEIASSTTGISTMVSYTSSQGGCAFGCHEVNPAGDNLGNPSNVTCTNGTKSFPSGGEDNYSLARCLGVSLRIDLVNQAVQSLMSTAATTASQNHTTYRAAIYTIDYSFNTLQALTSNLTTAQTSAANLSALQVYNQSCVTKTTCNNDEDSYLETGLSSANSVMPNPGSGTSNKGDTPQEVLFIVSDGVDDYGSGSSRIMAPMGTKSTWCSSIKNRGIRIAFLYLTYNPLPTNSFYNSNIKPFQPSIATDAQNCASAGLYFEVDTGGDITGALTQLFEKAVATAHLSQ
ncbi:TadE/TadG family type IV pilus assembly protein [Phenylobacterium montanum]|uniref:Pilus assembly protein n=1 Tax=Phenylobacterium montanum TaxID=2823693 RepID=A0A975G3Z1_9CAUL|nr:TadE/TadG family type IV pilus assembly protein [Caulobacter sp. S6]QUD90087.1 pilus assembly protein [Caulobacter sp. S6]